MLQFDEAKNNADTLIYQAEKTLKELGDKADAAKTDAIKEKIAALKEAMNSGLRYYYLQKLA